MLGVSHQTRIRSIIQRVDSLLRDYALAFGSAICVVFAASAIRHDILDLYWLDELLGLAAANVPSWTAIIQALSRGVDFNPPVYPVLAHTVIQAIGPTPLAFRLPATTGFIIFMVCLYLFTRRRLSAPYGLVAMLVPICTPVSEYAWDGRPYGVVLGFLGISMVAWQAGVDGQKRPLSLSLLALCLAAASATHYYAILLLFPFALGELSRLVQVKKIDWPITAAILLPLLTLIALLPLLTAHRAYLQHNESRGLPLMGLVYMLSDFSIYPGILIGIAALALSFSLLPGSKSGQREAEEEGFRVHEVFFMLGLTALPLLGAVVNTITHAYLSRYFLGAVGGISLVFTALLSRSSSRHQGVAVIAFLALFCYAAARWSFPLLHRPAPPQVPLAELSGAEEPLLMEDISDCLLADHYWRSGMKPWCLADPPESLRLQGFDSDDFLLLALRRVQGIRVDSYDHFAREHPKFLFLPSQRSIGWAFKKLREKQAQLKVSNRFHANLVYEVDLGLIPSSR